MNQNKIKKALEEIEPAPGARERMYQNILRKAAEQQTAPKEENITVFPARRPSQWKRWGSLAACLALVLAVGLLLPRLRNSDIEPPGPPVMVGSPYEDVAGPEDFAKLGFTIAAPAEAEDLYYYILDGEIAGVDFALNGHSYTYRAARLEGDFSGANGMVTGSSSLHAEYNATLDHLSPNQWRAHWEYDDVSCYLTSSDAAEEEITAVALSLLP